MTAALPALAGAAIGLIAGILVHLAIIRLPEAMEREWRRKAEEAGEAEEREVSPRCWSSRFSRRPTIMLICAAAFAPLAWRYGAEWETLAVMAASAILVALAAIDWRRRLLPDLLVLPLLSIGLLVNLGGMFASPGDALLGAAAGYGCLWVIARLWLLLSGQEGIGDGDIKLLAALGAWLGWRALWPLALIAALLALALVLPSIMRRRHEDQTAPYGSCLAIAAWLLFCFGAQPS